ncbi:MAG: Hsp33 family molecular chaperone HslO [Bacillota bacterium]
MEDHLVIATAAGDSVRIYAALTTQVVEDAKNIHDTWPTATAAFGRALTGTLMMGVMSDNLFRLTITISGNGPLGRILAVSNQRGKVKGEIANPQVDLDLNQYGKLDVSGAVGTGQMVVLKDYGLKEPYQGIVPLQNSEIAEDFAYYFTKSEQTPSAVALGVLVSPDGTVEAAGGLIVQLMPGVGEETIKTIEQKLEKFPGITNLLAEGVSPSQLVERMAPGPAKFLDRLPVFYHCDCSWEKFRGPLLSLDPGELNSILKEQGRVEVQCHFCKQFYYYDTDQLSENAMSK